MSGNTCSIIGVMSGSSLDGLDIALCYFTPEEQQLKWEIKQAATIHFDENWIERLRNLPNASAIELAKADADFGILIGRAVSHFIDKHQLKPDLIASHGHTIFHYPKEHFSLQIGDGAAIAAICGYSVADNFRMQDVVLGGQGAPLAPIVDQLLFPDYSLLLNIGGIANLSCRTQEGYIGFDLTGANQLLNHLANSLGMKYDKGGYLASKGHLITDLLDQINQLPYFAILPPKSLGNDWVREQLIPLFDQYDASVEHKLHTACWHVAEQVAKAVKIYLPAKNMETSTNQMLVSGGGAYNDFLIRCIRSKIAQHTELEIHVPDSKIIEYKEALLMALLGYLRLKKHPNCLPSTTGAVKAASTGALHLGWKVLSYE